VSLGSRLCFVVIAARDQLRAGVPDGVSLRARGISRDVDGQGQPGSLCGIRERASVIAGGCGHQRRSAVTELFAQPQDGVERAADLVRESRLQALELEKYLTAGNAGQPRRIARRRTQYVFANPSGGGADVVDRNQDGDASAWSRISAS
jgi:hypothetical protein